MAPSVHHLHSFAHLCQRLVRDHCGLPIALAKHLTKVALVGCQFTTTFPNRGEIVVEGSGETLLERARASVTNLLGDSGRIAVFRIGK